MSRSSHSVFLQCCAAIHKEVFAYLSAIIEQSPTKGLGEFSDGQLCDSFDRLAPKCTEIVYSLTMTERALLMIELTDLEGLDQSLSEQDSLCMQEILDSWLADKLHDIGIAMLRQQIEMFGPVWADIQNDCSGLSSYLECSR